MTVDEHGHEHEHGHGRDEQREGAGAGGDGPRRPALPRGGRRRIARLPIGLFRIGLGPLFGHRLLLLHHTGRVSGRDRKVVLEVVAHDPEHGTWTLASGFGPGAAWYRNLKATPRATIQVGNRRHAVTARFLTEAEGAEIMARYAPLHPRTARRLCAFMGFEVDGSPAAYRRAGRGIPFVRLVADPGGQRP
ncbi:nitroreductase family deazaflavin-dependent oxidoreductase [Streptomyces sp. SID5785]|uniref:nitroreductase family deazaflavin-dependent oxidoreductase n=1 Tax=Streptomyces sp. SID5785 TaxID=2690309 RepID=UPI00136145F2|nr:nitroreductase family deazaflavin-dependent oxidoreductase [Streptomyces sp. SID5785]MZD05739.1 nitroreductase family deazaflavin-dependent oxidoreductase [Streptomyces sp. SID5785]